MKISRALLAASLVFAVTALWVRMELRREATVKTKGIDTDARLGASPVQPSKAAAVQKGVLQILLEGGGRLFTSVKSSTIQDTRPLQRFNNPASAVAASTAPIRTDYTPTSYAKLN